MKPLQIALSLTVKLLLRTLTDFKYFDPAVDLLIRAVSSPVYSKSEVDKVIGDMLIDLSLKDESPSQIAQEAIWSEIYKGHPYSNYPGGKKSSISSITPSQLLEFHRSCLLYTSPSPRDVP